jgi:hypothetical protein
MQPASWKGRPVKKPGFKLKLQQIEISSEEILADLLYPAPRLPPQTAPKRARHRPRIQG